MEKYINAERLIEEFKSIHPDSQLMYASAFAEFVKDMPSADVALVVHGYWIIGGVNENRVIGNWECSVCKGVSLKDSSFCPSCGAKMDLAKV